MIDTAFTADPMRREVLRGLSQAQKQIPCKYLYDERGCDLFEAICELPEYYPTRTELAIMAAHVADMAAWMGPRPVVVELGSGSGIKTERLLAAADRPAAYVPVEIAPEYLAPTVARLRERFPDLAVAPVLADFTTEFALPDLPPAGRRIVYFPGSTIGNFTPRERRGLLTRMAGLVGPGGGALLGIDLIKGRQTLEDAYDDRAGVTAAFNLNLLTRINRELGADFDVEAFAHRAVWNEADARIEMHLVSRRRQRVTIADRTIAFAPAETICTEYSHKFDPEQFTAMVEAAGFRVANLWTDPDDLFAVVALDRPE